MITELLNINLIKELGLDSLPPEKRMVLLNQMSEVVENRINIEVLSTLSDEDKKELDKILDSDGDMIGFLKEKIPNFEMMVAETIANFKKEAIEMSQMSAEIK